jgi:hypothetical protein
MHKYSEPYKYIDESELIDRICLALSTNLFYIIYLVPNGIMNKQFLKVLKNIQNKYYYERNPVLKADFAVATGTDLRFFLLKKSRMTKEQLFHEIANMYKGEESRGDILNQLHEQARLDEDKDAIPLMSESPREKVMMSQIDLAIEKYFNKTLDECIDEHHFESHK